MTKLVDLVERTLRDHQLVPKQTKEGVTVWECPTCGAAFLARDASHGIAQCAHQARVVLAAIRDA